MTNRSPTTTFLATIALSSLLALTAGTAAAAPSCQPHIHDGWVRITPGGMGMLAGYARIENPCHDAAALTGVRSATFADVSLHETTVVGGISRMRPVPRLALAPGRVVTLQPGGLHLMLMQPTHALKAGEHVVIDFALEDGRTLSADFILRAMTP